MVVLAKQEAKSTTILFVPESKVEVTDQEFKLEIRCKTARSIPATQRMHSFHVADGKLFTGVNSTHIEERGNE